VVAARLNRAHADLVELTLRVLEGERWAGGGIRSPEHWLVLHAGLSPARAGDVVRLARRSTQLPTTVAAMAAGQVSVDQAAVVARFAPSSHEASVGELASMTTVPQLRRALSRYQFGSGSPAAGGAGGSPIPRVVTSGTCRGRWRTRRRRRSCRCRTGTGGSSCGTPPRPTLRRWWSRRCGGQGRAVHVGSDRCHLRGCPGRDRRPVARVGRVRQPGGSLPGLRPSVHERVVGRWTGSDPTVAGGQVRVRRDGAAGVGGRRHTGQRGA
jgi:hypothetical protein